MRNQNAPLMVHLLCCVIQKEEEGASKNDRHGRHQEDPKWIYTSQAFLDVPMPIVLRPSFLPLPCSPSSSKHPNRCIIWLFNKIITQQARRKRMECLRTIGMGGIGKHRTKLPPLLLEEETNRLGFPPRSHSHCSQTLSSSSQLTLKSYSYKFPYASQQKDCWIKTLALRYLQTCSVRWENITQRKQTTHLPIGKGACDDQATVLHCKWHMQEILCIVYTHMSILMGQPQAVLRPTHGTGKNG